MKNLSVILVTLVTAKADLSEIVRSAFDSLPRLVTRRRYGRVNEVEKQAIRFFYENGISREEIAVKLAISFQTVYFHTR